MSQKKDDIILRLEPEWKLLLDTLTKVKKTSRNQVLSDLVKGWILSQLSALSNTNFADTPQGLQDAVEALLKFRDEERARDAESDGELLQYLSRCKEIQAERQAAELQRLNQQEEERRNAEEQKAIYHRYRRLEEDLANIFLKIIPTEDLISIHGIWKENITKSYDSDNRDEYVASLIRQMIDEANKAIGNYSLISNNPEINALKEEASKIIKESRSFCSNNIVSDALFAAYSLYEMSLRADEEEIEEE